MNLEQAIAVWLYLQNVKEKTDKEQKAFNASWKVIVNNATPVVERYKS